MIDPLLNDESFQGHSLVFGKHTADMGIRLASMGSNVMRYVQSAFLELVVFEHQENQVFHFFN